VNFEIKDMKIMPSGLIYMLCRQGKAWMLRSVDGVNLAKYPIIIKNRIANIKYPKKISREEAFNRLIDFGISKDDSGVWMIAGLDIIDDKLRKYSKLVMKSLYKKEVKGMYKLITSMAKM